VPCDPNADPQPFLRANGAAWRFVAKGTDDYLLARLGMPGLLSSAFGLATQSVEKYLKAYLLFQDKGLNGAAEAVRGAVSIKAKVLGRTQERGHDIESALALATDIGFPCSNALRVRIKRINSYYAMRYPYGEAPTSYGGRDLHDYDETVFELWAAFKDVNADYYYASGPHSPVYSLMFSDLHRQTTDFERRHFTILTQQNLAYARRRLAIEADIRELLGRRYSNQST
jgi:hypothetical protein